MAMAMAMATARRLSAQGGDAELHPAARIANSKVPAPSG
jgi:hypothetical protein